MSQPEQAELLELRSANERLLMENAKLRAKLADAEGETASCNGDNDQTAAANPSDNMRLFRAFLRGIGSVLEAFPNPGRFDRWRIKDTIPDNEWALLFRELCATSSEEKKGDGAGA